MEFKVQWLTVLFLTTLFLSGCDTSLFSPQKNEMRILFSSEISTLDPAQAYDSVSSMVTLQCYETLYQYHYLKRPYDLVPLLADGMPIFYAQGKKVRIKIKKNIFYIPDPSLGTAPRTVKAEDFEMAIKRLAFTPTESTGKFLFEDSLIGFNEFSESVGNSFEKLLSQSISGIKIINDHLIELQFKRPYPLLINSLAMNFVAPIPKESVIYYKNNLSAHCIGTGPYAIKKYNPTGETILEKNTNYHYEDFPITGDRYANGSDLLSDAGKRLPFIDRIFINIVTDHNLRWKMFEEHQADYIDIPKDKLREVLSPRGDLSEKYQKKDLTLHVNPTLTFWWLAFNMQHPIWGKNHKLRLAIAHAINIKEYVDLVTSKNALLANSIYLPGIQGYDPTTKLPYVYNPKKAQEILKEAGHPNGKGLPPLIFSLRAKNQLAITQAEFIKKELEKIGIQVQIEPLAFNDFLSRSRKGVLNFWIEGWALDFPDSVNILQLLTKKNHPPGPNSTLYSSNDFDNYFSEIQELPHGDKKLELMKKMEKIVFRDLPWIMLYYSREHTLVRSHVKNFRSSDIILNHLKYIKIDH